jgi:hypothetical protein
MDGNGYEGLQRDMKGNRRFYPMFVGQTDDVDGKPAWELGFKANLGNLREDLWQYLAEARAWWNKHGEKEYVKFVTKCADGVFKFSEAEMAADRGTIADDELDTFLLPAIRLITPIYRRRGKLNQEGMVIPPHELAKKLKTHYRMNYVNHNHLLRKMESIGFKYMSGTGGKKMWFFEGVANMEEMHKKLGIDGSEYDPTDDDDDYDDDGGQF